MKRRTFVRKSAFAGTAAALCVSSQAETVGANAAQARIGICAFSCHQHWKAVQTKFEGVQFTDVIGFYRYARILGAEGVQTRLRPADTATAKAMRDLVEKDGGYYEGDLRLPKNEGELAAFETDVRLAREAGAAVARAVFTSNRRYEFFKTMQDFRAFHAQAEKTLTLIEPVARRHRLKVAIENHKDHTAEELAAMMRTLGSEWVGVLVDTGNNIALLEDPYAVIETLAPFALSVHLKDMAVRPSDNGFLLSETPLGTGALDLPRIIATLAKANPHLVFNLEMATRDPLHVPCLVDGYFVTFPERRTTRLDAMMEWVKANPPRQPPPIVSGKAAAQILAEEETNNRLSLRWMAGHLRR